MSQPKRIVTEKDGITVWTGDALLDHALKEAGFDVEDLRRSLQRMREGLDAVLPEKHVEQESLTKVGGVVTLRRIERGGAPDHAVRLRAAEDLFEWIGFRGKRERDLSGPTRPVAVQVVVLAQPPASTNGHAPVGLQPPRRVEVSFAGDATPPEPGSSEPSQ